MTFVSTRSKQIISIINPLTKSNSILINGNSLQSSYQILKVNRSWSLVRYNCLSSFINSIAYKTPYHHQKYLNSHQSTFFHSYQDPSFNIFRSMSQSTISTQNQMKPESLLESSTDCSVTPPNSRSYSDNTGSSDNKTEEQPNPKDKKSRFKALIRDYGVTAVVFHVTISLASLGICYLLVSSSLPMDKIFTFLGVDKKLGNLSDAASTSTNFVVAYAVHKSLALVRLSITAACVPVVVRYLRSKGILKNIVSKK